MAVRIFVSSTNQDLQDVCRKPAINIIDSYHPKAIAEAMEKWNEDHINAVVICKEKLEISTHYMGIFAFRRGWVPGIADLGNRSITEAEYDWAIESRKTPYILIPSNESEIGRRLRVDALNQSATEHEDQRTFLTRVKSNGVVKIFNSNIDFEESVRDKVNEWVHKAGKSLLAHVGTLNKPSSVESNSNSTNTSNVIPKSLDNFVSPREIGRVPHIFSFENADKLSRRKPKYTATCYLIYGEDGTGHNDLIHELRNRLNPSHRFFSMSCLSLLSDVDANALNQQIWNSLTDGRDSFTSDLLIQELKNRLQYQDIVIQLNNLEEFKGTVEEFVENFWIPLNSSIVSETSNRLIIFAPHVGSDIAPFQSKLHFIANSFKLGDSHQLISLPELVPVELEDIKDWLESNYAEMSSNVLEEQSQRLFDKCRGNPETLFKILNSM